MGKQITWNDFEKVEIRVGTIIEARDFPEARKPAYRLVIDFGKLGTRKSSAQITDLYGREGLVGRQVLAVTNFPPKQVGPFMSECLVLGLVERDGVVLIGPDRPVTNGLRIA
jgi:tRNA-binding protein